MRGLATVLLLHGVLHGCLPGARLAAQEPDRGPDPFAPDNLVAWCIVPFDARNRGPEERAAMLARLGLKRVAYDWRERHVASFEAEILAYEKHGLEYFAFWGWHPAMAALITKHGIRPQIWQTSPSPQGADREARIAAACRQLMPLVERTRTLGVKLGLYNHGGWGGEPVNLVAVCQRLRAKGGSDHVGIVYNFHHGHGHIDDFAAALGQMLPYLLCLNLNGMNDGGQPKILPIGAGRHERRMLRIVRDLGYRGPIGILDHVPETDAEVQLRKNLDGLLKLRAELAAEAAAAPGATSPRRPAAEIPFPGNRVRGFYARQARHWLRGGDAEPKVLPAFPGLDGGSFGHWGQNPEADNFDRALDKVDLGGLLAQVVRRGQESTGKAVSVQVGERGERTVLFDPLRLTFTDAWRGGLVVWSPARFGITSGVQPAGKRELDRAGEAWDLPEGTPTRYLGFYRNGRRVVFAYRIGAATVYDHPWFDGERITRWLSVAGELPEGARLRSALQPEFDRRAEALSRGAEPQWTKRTVVTRGQRGNPLPDSLGIGSAFAIDTLTVPYRDQNPFRTPMRIGGFDFLPDGRIAVGTLVGDVWLVGGVDDQLPELTWQRIAAGLHQCLGLVVRDGAIHVLGRDQITRLTDLNGDGEADFYECVTNEYPTEGGNNFALTLHQDSSGTLYWFTRSKGYGMTRFAPGSRPESIATGLRGTNGTGVSPDGRIVFATVQEGSWTPATAIFEVGSGSYHGFSGPRKGHGPQGHGPQGYDLPVCFVPRGVDNSAGDLLFLPEDERLGPLGGRIVGTSFGYCEHYLVLREVVGTGAGATVQAGTAQGGTVQGGTVQGGTVPLPGEFLSGAHRSRFNPRDGHLYVAGTDGWQSYARADGSLQRLRHTGGTLRLPRAVETRSNGLIVRFDTRLAAPTTEAVFAEQWNYLYGPAYGSQEYSVKHPGVRGHDRVPVRSVHLVEDGKALFVEIPQLHPVMTLHLYMELATAEGVTFPADLYYTVRAMGEPFVGFPGYRQVAKGPAPEFPVQGSFPLDPRLVRQDALGKFLGGGVARTLRAVAGLKFAPTELAVPRGRRIALTFENTDPSMPHNFALVRPDRLEVVGLASMKMAADPEAVAKHYVPEDEGVICMAPILDPGGSYTVYFDSPKESGDYPFLCTYPGHWVVMRGVLKVR